MLKIKILIILLCLRKFSEGCQLNFETCECTRSNENDSLTHMSCLESSMHTSIVLNFDTLFTWPYNPITINIQNKNISKIESTGLNKLLANITKLTIIYCNIKKIGSNSFLGFVYLSELYLFENEIEILENNSFYNLDNHLKRLELYSNKIQEIKANTFNNLNVLDYLDLSPNEITTVETHSFDGLVNLKILFLSLNKIELIQKDLLGPLISLEYFSFTRNEISNIEANSLDGMQSLTELRLYSNKLRLIKKNMFSSLIKLERLLLHKNEIEKIEVNSFYGMASLKKLYLNSNRLKYVSSGLFSGLYNLEELLLNENQIKSIQLDSFQDLRKLTYLALFRNKIETIKDSTFSNLIHLSSLDLSQNNLISIEYGTFQNLSNLDLFDLSHNYLDGLSEKIFENFDFNGSLNLDFNFVKRLGANFFLNSLYNLNELNLRNNELVLIEDNSLRSLYKLEKLYLDFNMLSEMNEKAFSNLAQLKVLSLNSNKLKHMSMIRDALKNFKQLESIDFSRNFLEFVNKSDFNFNTKLRSINLNENFLKRIEVFSFRNLFDLKIFKISTNNLEYFEMNSLNWYNLSEVDLSFNRLDFNKFDIANTFQNLDHLDLANVAIVQKNISIEIFLNSKLNYLDLSGHNFSTNNFKIFDNLPNLATFKLRKVGLQSMEQINFSSFERLTHLDLSFNNLTHLKYESFERLQNLENLDLSHNFIRVIDKMIFSKYEQTKVASLNYLNLQSNKIISIESTFTNYFNLFIFQLSNNNLEIMPKFSENIYGGFTGFNAEFYLDHNQLTTIQPISYASSTLETLNFDFNQIHLIEHDSFFHLKLLKNLSISNNRLKNVSKNNFNFLHDLNYLNLSFNQIIFIENDSFINLNKLIWLDLNFNSFLLVDANLFNGLTLLSDLFLLSNHKITLNIQSFLNVKNIANIYLNELMVTEYKCIFMHSIYRELKRSILNKYNFYKSINLITNASLIYDLNQCELTFHLLQFKIHLNLKSDYENELFYEKCAFSLVKKSNSFNRNYQKCFKIYLDSDEYMDRLGNDGYFLEEKANFIKIFTNYTFYLIIGLIFFFFAPIYFMIFHHLYFR